MANINYAEISNKVKALAKVLNEQGYAYTAGYMTSLVSSVVSAYVPQADRQLVLDDIQEHIDTMVARKQEAA